MAVVRYISVYPYNQEKKLRLINLAWGVWHYATGGCCDQHSLPKLWAMVPGPRYAKGKAIELGERVDLVFWAEIKVLIIESGGLGGNPSRCLLPVLVGTWHLGAARRGKNNSYSIICKPSAFSTKRSLKNNIGRLLTKNENMTIALAEDMACSTTDISYELSERWLELRCCFRSIAP